MTLAELRILDDVASQGAHVAHASHGDGLESAYTVGLWHTYAHPEVLVCGLPPEVARELLEQVTDEIDAGRRFEVGTAHEGIVRHYAVRCCAVPPAQVARWLPLVAWAYDGREVPCVQIVYPDKQGRWPWDGDVRDGFRRAQPVLERGADATGPG